MPEVETIQTNVPTIFQLPLCSAVLGIGSPHGDDRVGWCTIQSLRSSLDSAILLREIASPAQILDHLEGVNKLILVDGCRCGRPLGTLLRFRWPHAALQHCRAASSHALGLVEAITLAETLGRLPDEVIIVLMEIGEAEPGKELSAIVQEALPELEAVVKETLNNEEESPAVDTVEEAGR